MTKKILIMVASPKNEKSGTLVPTKAFVDGMLANGDYEAEYVFIDRLNIKPCRGCLTCWGRPDGSCFIKDDDVPATRKKLETADVVIWSFPLFLFSIPGQMKVLMDRIVGMVHPYMGQKLNEPDSMNKPMHGLQNQKPGQKIILLSSCAWCDLDVVYEPIVRQFDIILGKGGYTLIACPQMRALHHRGGKRRLDILRKNYAQGGAELAKTGTLSQEAIDLMQKPLFGEETYKELVVQFVTHMFDRDDNF
ncbi:flavodoxin family protein [Fibrobacter intestinalis]|uniref:Flavodoxin-like fold n=1 Tax=Fibrobacter intestinalis TaxID=28122 RepID=A0A1T4LZA4_9BACT|nr:MULTISPECIES: flavodoxin family protein [Fibrobacter]PBC74818.1 NADPH-dependent FMN reductase [Fibrobacter sp. NR9]SJZ59981.1 Flavodoxin-like fold [Fibrobacter intestinalis]